MKTAIALSIAATTVLASRGASAGDATRNEPDKARFISCMDAQAGATNMAESTNGPEATLGAIQQRGVRANHREDF